MSIHKIGDKNRVFVSEDITRGENPVDTNAKVKKFIKNNFSEVKNQLPDGSTGITYVTDTGAGEFAFSEYTKGLKGKMKYDKFRMANNIDEIIASQIISEYEDPAHPRDDDIVGFYRMPVEIQVGHRLYDGDLVTGITLEGREEFYDVVSLELKNENEPYPTPAESSYGRHDSDSSNNSIAPKGDAVNPYSMPEGGEYSVHNRNNNSVKPMEVGNLYNSMLQEGYITPEEGERYRGVSLRVRQSGEAVGANDVQIAEAEKKQHIQKSDMV